MSSQVRLDLSGPAAKTGDGGTITGVLGHDAFRPAQGGIADGPSPFTATTAYEHRVSCVAVPRRDSDDNDNTSALVAAVAQSADESGAEGWELVSTNFQSYPDLYEMWLIFKRPYLVEDDEAGSGRHAKRSGPSSP